MSFWTQITQIFSKQKPKPSSANEPTEPSQISAEQKKKDMEQIQQAVQAKAARFQDLKSNNHIHGANSKQQTTIETDNPFRDD
ncbi:MAG: hypothetical protein U9Q67_04735 [Patescibacteria group bacterium]|nr:hypothetical protein [Patescibacteria group bacterium]